MDDLCRLIWCAVVGLFRSRAALQAEILVLRHQLNVLRRRSPKRVAFGNLDRLVFTGLYRLAPAVLDALKILKPETLIRWHRAGFRAYWRWKSRPRGGRPATAAEIRQLIREMSVANPLWGAPRIHGELLKLGIDVGQTTVAKYMAKRRRPPSQGWKTFLRNHADAITSMDLFVVPTVSFRLLYGFLVLRHCRRELLWLSVTAHPTAEWIARQLTEAYGWQEAPRYIVRDRDGAYGEVFVRRLAAMGIRDRPISALSPWQNGYAERVIGSIRRDCLDHVVVFGEEHLRHLLNSYQKYYNEVRTHLSLRKDVPVGRNVRERAVCFQRQSWAAYTINMFESEFPTRTTPSHLLFLLLIFSSIWRSSLKLFQRLANSSFLLAVSRLSNSVRPTSFLERRRPSRISLFWFYFLCSSAL
jgi:Integrase core domain